MTICKGLTKIDRAMGIAINRQAEIVNDWNNAKTLDKPIEVTAKNTNSSNVDSITISEVKDDDRVKIMSSEKTEGERFSRTYDEALNNPLSFKDKFTKTVADYTESEYYNRAWAFFNADADGNRILPVEDIYNFYDQILAKTKRSENTR